MRCVRLLKLEAHTHTHRECLLSDEILQVRVHGKSVLVSEAQGEIGILHSDTGHRRYSPRSIGLGVVVGINATLFLVAAHDELVVGVVGESVLIGIDLILQSNGLIVAVVALHGSARSEEHPHGARNLDGPTELHVYLRHIAHRAVVAHHVEHVLVDAHAEEATHLVHVVFTIRESDRRILGILVGKHARMILALVEQQLDAVDLLLGQQPRRAVVLHDLSVKGQCLLILFFAVIILRLLHRHAALVHILQHAFRLAVVGIRVVRVVHQHLLIEIGGLAIVVHIKEQLRLIAIIDDRVHQGQVLIVFYRIDVATLGSHFKLYARLVVVHLLQFLQASVSVSTVASSVHHAIWVDSQERHRLLWLEVFEAYGHGVVAWRFDAELASTITRARGKLDVIDGVVTLGEGIVRIGCLVHGRLEYRLSASTFINRLTALSMGKRLLKMGLRVAASMKTSERSASIWNDVPRNNMTPSSRVGESRLSGTVSGGTMSCPPE